jgi:ZIP family zinc transporter
MDISLIIAAIVASGSLTAGAVLGVVWTPPKRLIATILAFASGAFITALATDLFVESAETAGIVPAGTSLLAGAIVYVGAILVLERSGHGGQGMSLFLGSLFDGIPESVALGISFVGGGGALPLFAAIVVNNVPEGIGGATDMQSSGSSRSSILILWTATGIVLFVAVIAGNVFLQDASPETLAVIRSFAGGAILATLADATMPEAFDEGGPAIAIATAVGFLLTFALTLV